MTFFFKSLLLLILITNNSFGQTTVGLMQHSSGTLDDGYILFAPIQNTTTYLIDKCGRQVKTWPSTYRPGQSCYILPDGTLLRSGNTNNTTFNAGGKGGIIQKIDWNGNVTWSYTVSSTLECQHHDIKALPNGNVLAIVWESKTNSEAIAQGRNPALTTTTVWSEKIIEIQPTGLTTGTIVWEWHLWDHLVQDFDNTKSNYGVVASNPPKPFQIDMIDNFGRRIYSKTNAESINSFSIDIEKFSKGIYLVLFKFEKQLVTKKIIIE